MPSVLTPAAHRGPGPGMREHQAAGGQGRPGDDAGLASGFRQGGKLGGAAAQDAGGQHAPEVTRQRLPLAEVIGPGDTQPPQGQGRADGGWGPTRSSSTARTGSNA